MSEEQKDLTPEYVASLTMSKGDDGEFVFDDEKFAAVPLEEKERITSALHNGDLTDDDLLAAARAAETETTDDTPDPADDDTPDPADDDTPDPADDTPDPAEDDEPEVDARAEVSARKAALRAKYNEAVADLKADIDAKEPDDKYSSEWEDWDRKRKDALAKRSDLRDQLDADIEAAESAAYADISARSAGQKASADLAKVASSVDLFKGRVAVTDFHKTVTKVYRPWLERVVKANGGDPSKQEDVNAAWARFHSDAEFAKHPDIKSPENLKDVLLAVTAYDSVVSRGMSPRAALIDAAEKSGVIGDWEAALEAERRAKHEADLKGQAASVQDALSRRNAATPPDTFGTGPLSPSSTPEPTDLASAQEWMAAYFARKDAAIAKGREYVMSKEEKALHAKAEEIIVQESTPGQF